MTRRTERGASYVPLIIVIVLLIVAVVWAYLQTEQVAELERSLAAAQQDQTTMNEAFSELSTFVQRELSPKVGFSGTENFGRRAITASQPEEVTTFIQNKLEELKELKTTIPISVFEEDENGAIRRQEAGENVEVGWVRPQRIPAETTLQELYELMLSALRRANSEVQDLASFAKARQQDLTSAEQGFRQTVAEKDSAIQEVRQEKDRLQQAKTQAEADLRAEISGLRDQIEQVRNDFDELQTEARATRLELEQSLSVASQQLRRLMDRRPPEPKVIGPDGEVLAVTADQGIIVLNRGKQDHLMTGTRFLVYNYGKGARKQPKGYATVIRVDDTTAQARVEELLDEMRPITPGDEIESPSYDPDEKLTFVLLGRFKKYGKSDAERRLEQIGQNVADNVTVDTDYLVMGSPESEEDDLRATDIYKRARELGVRIITEEQLSTFLRY